MFFTQIVRRRVVPLYRHPALHHTGEPVMNDSGNIADGDMSDGDDHVWLENLSALANGRWRGLAASIYLKRRMREEEVEEDTVGVARLLRAGTTIDGGGDYVEMTIGG